MRIGLFIYITPLSALFVVDLPLPQPGACALLQNQERVANRTQRGAHFCVHVFMYACEPRMRLAVRGVPKGVLRTHSA